MFEFLRKGKNEEKDVYDVINARVEADKKEIYLSIAKLTPILLKIKRLQDSGKENDLLMFEFLQKLKPLVPHIESMFHYEYEIMCDVDRRYGYERFCSILSEKDFNQTEFAVKYVSNRNQIIKILAFFALLRKNNISLEDLIGKDDADLALRIFNNQDMSCAIDNIFDRLSAEDLDLLESIVDNRNRYKEPSQEVTDLANEYHERYMQEFIYPFATKKECSDDKLVKLALKANKSEKYGSK